MGCPNERGDNGLFKNRLGTARCILCFVGLLLVVCIGIAAGLLAKYLPPYMAELKLSQYQRAAEKAGQSPDRYFLLTEANEDECTNYQNLTRGFLNSTDSLVWQCKNNECIPDYLRCSGYYDCMDKSDEDDCSGVCKQLISDGLSFACKEERSNGTYNDQEYGPADPPCFFHTYRCDAWVDCPQDSPSQNDEADCDQGLHFVSSTGEQKTCGNGNSFLCRVTTGSDYCTQGSYVCDGFNHCENREDEMGCKDE